jgi:hypothetical protein
VPAPVGNDLRDRPLAVAVDSPLAADPDGLDGNRFLEIRDAHDPVRARTRHSVRKDETGDDALPRVEESRLRNV